MQAGYWWLIGLLVLAYLLGSVPFGLVIALARGVDPRKFGSGNIGATNVGRALGGVKWFFGVFFCDLLKSLLPMLAAAAVVHRMIVPPLGAGTYLLWIAVGLAAILGHMFSLYLHFRGGKGVATSCGVALGVWPFLTWPAVVAMVSWIGVFAITRYISLASVVAAIVFPLAYVGFALALGWPLLGAQLPLLVCAGMVGGLIVWRHRDNIARLRAGTEHRMGSAAKR